MNFKKIKLSSEADYGIRHYMNPFKGIQGILKHRFSDFIVQEVDLNDLIVTSPSCVLRKENTIKNHSNIQIENAQDEILKIFSQQKQEISQMLQNKLQTGETLKSDQIQEKEERTLIHKITKTYFSHLSTSTIDNCIVFTLRNSKERERVDWNELGGQFLEFTMEKENMDTLEAIDVIASRIRRPVKSFNFAGTKDKRGITIQKVTGFKVLEENLQNLEFNGIKIGDFKYRNNRIELGDLNGNRFSIIIRDLTQQGLDGGSNEEVEAGLEAIKENGFVNYYGMQRFGTHSIPTYSAGICLLKGEWADAVHLILKAKDEDNDRIKEARRVWFEDKDAKKALKLFPRRCVGERAILGFFSKTSRVNDHLGAVTSIPRNLRLLYVHSYQSWVWNEMASQRMQMYGNKLQAGDLVDASSYLGENKDSDKNSHILVLTEDDLGKYSMDDLVLPLPGYDVKYPKNGMLEAYNKFMASHGFDPNDMRRKQKDFSLPGSYRKVLVKPKDFEWKLVRYDDPNAELPLSQVDDGKYLALMVKFTLPTSSYATMCLREFLKSETSSAYHHELSKATAAVDEEVDDSVS